MARSRVNVSPKISSQRAGWMALVTSSCWSWRMRHSSTVQNVSTRLGRMRHQAGAAATSTEAARSSAGAADIAESPLLVELAAGVVAEHVLQGGPVSELGPQLIRPPERPDRPVVHQRDPLAELLRLLHVVRGEQDRHAGLRAQR